MFERLISTQIEDEDLARRARLLNILVVVWGAFVALGLIIGVVRSIAAGTIAAQGTLLLSG